MTVSFKGEPVSFLPRLIKKLAPILIAFVAIYIKINYGRHAKDFAQYSGYLYAFGLVCFFIGLFYHIRDIRTVVTKVTFFDDKIEVSGLDFNSSFRDILNIDETLLEIKQKENNERLYIEIYSNDKYYYINSYSDWNKQTMVRLIDEYKSRTDKMVFGGDYLLKLSQT